MKKKIKILHIEDVASDAELVDRELKMGNIQFEKLVVDNKIDFLKAIHEFSPDIILADHSLPSLDSTEAIKIIKSHGVHIPFILVTATVSDDRAVQVMKAGADDYILKDRLHRLPKAVKNAIEKSRLNLKLHESETFNNGVLSSLGSHIAVIDQGGTLIAVNKAWNDYGIENGILSLYPISEGINYFDVCRRSIKQGDPDAALALTGIKSVLSQEKTDFEMEYPCHSPEQQRWFMLSVKPFGTDTKKVVISHLDITTQKLAEQSLLFSQSNLTAMIENTDALIYSLDPDFCFIAFNKKLFDSLKQRFNVEIKAGDNAITLLEMHDPQEADQWRTNFEQALRGETVKFESSSTNNEYIHYVINSINPVWGNNRVVGLSCFVYDITKQKADEVYKEKLTADLIQRNHDLEQFTYIVSHNLRAPAANIMGFSDLLQNKTITPAEQLEFLKGLSLSVAGLDTIIRDINSILQVKQNVKERKELVNFSSLVNTILVNISSIIDKHHAHVEVDFSDVNEIYSNNVYMYSIFYNLISNSIKYSRPNVLPQIEIKSKKENGMIILTFKDNGMGIDMKKNSDKLFGLYNRFHFHVEGKGMGLFMVKTQVESLGGTVSMTSELNSGTVVTIVIQGTTG